MFGFSRKPAATSIVLDAELYYGIESGRIDLARAGEAIADWFYGVQAGRFPFPTR